MHRATVVGGTLDRPVSMSSVQYAANASSPSRANAFQAASTISTFSCDIAYAVSLCCQSLNKVGKPREQAAA
jgi:hypothetical protein